LDSNGDVFVTGWTDGHFPLVNASQSAFGGITDAFVAMINRLGSALVYSTYLGGSGQDGGAALALDSTGNAYVTGTTTSPNFPTVKPIQGRGPGSDSFLAVLESPTAGLPAMSLSRSTLNYGATGSIVTSPQTIEVSFTAGQAVSWTASANQPNIAVSPSSGNGRGGFQVSVTAGPSGVITVVAQASNSPQQVQVHIESVASGGPYGSFDTPSDGVAGISGAIAVTGWALDAIEVSKVDIWREPIGSELPQANGLVYIADADIVPGARPDVEAAFPISPLNYRAGWGYLMLTNGLPGSGNGTYKLHAITHSTTGLAKELGTRTITVDNTHAAKPFGSIDTPTQGGTVSGNAFVNFGWALTPNPAAIATDGSTITVVVDGVPLGHVTYNQFRSDIATLFPGLANSNGAVGFFYIDTTKLSNGLHTISWNVFDNNGRGDGIGSRYFNVFNNGGVAAREQTALAPMPAQGAIFRGRGNRNAQRLEPDANGVLKVDVQELEWIEVDLGASDGLPSGERRKARSSPGLNSEGRRVLLASRSRILG